MPAWKKAKGLLISEPAYVMGMMKKDASYVLVDLRPAEAAEKGHIKGAVTVPASKLADSRGMFPEDKSAPIILYGKGVNVDAFKTVRGWGYKNVSVMNGGTAGWQKAKGKLFAGEMAGKIVYVKKIPKNEIGIEEFKAVVKKQPTDTVILDVRDAPAASAGMLPGAVNIPLDDLEARVAELPRDKELIIHCNTGIMAGMAQGKLEKQGYKTKILNAIVQVDADGSYEINEK
jgi:rhodanese-related sulfurtransferase